MKLLSYQQASERLGVKVGTLYAWVSQERIPHIRLGNRCVRFDAHELAAWVEDHHVFEPEGGLQ